MIFIIVIRSMQKELDTCKIVLAKHESKHKSMMLKRIIS